MPRDSSIRLVLYLARSDHQVLYLEYQGQGRQYPNSNELSYFDSLASLTGRQPVTYWADVEVRGAWEEAFVKFDGHFRTERTGGAAVILQLVHDVQVRVWGN